MKCNIGVKYIGVETINKMSQDKVIKFLKKHKKPYTAKQIANKLKIGYSSTTKNILRLSKQGIVKSIPKKIGPHWIGHYYI